jgi:CRISPR-associated protein Cmr2
LGILIFSGWKRSHSSRISLCNFVVRIIKPVSFENRVDTGIGITEVKQGDLNVSRVFWQAKIWGLLHDPALKALHDNSGRGGNSFWRDLAVMADWVDAGWDPEESGGIAFKQILLADYVASASDRGAIGAIPCSLNYDGQGLQIHHLLSGESLRFQLNSEIHKRLGQSNRGDFLKGLESTLIPEEIRQSKETRQVFWWLWRCLPEAACHALGQDPQILLSPAETRLPDSSIWSHTSLTSALAGAFAGYDLTTEELNRWPSNQETSHAYLAVFSFTPVQELIKASRKMRDFWAGSWLLHYLSAKVCWALASKYGPDSVLYPSLSQQPLIDHWILQQWPEFERWVTSPRNSQLLTAGFPNVIVMVLPKAKVQAAMQFAEETLKREWLAVGKMAFEELTQNRGWMQGLSEGHKTWGGWLSSQWQSYWSAVAIGKEGEPLKNAALEEGRAKEFEPWVKLQNQTFGVVGKGKLFQERERQFLQDAYKLRLETQGRRFSVNIGSWWPHIFDSTRRGLAGVKNARTWSLPTAFGIRSTVSGIGPAVHPGEDWKPEGEVKQGWKHHAGLFDGSEQLNATETVKRVLHKVLPQLLDGKIADYDVTYPDLTAGVAGYLKTSGLKHQTYFQRVCREMRSQLKNRSLNAIAEEVPRTPWGIPWTEEQSWGRGTHSRYLNVGWLLQDSDEAASDEARKELQKVLDLAYPSNNPADWYVLAAGDGDDMSEWLKGTKLKPYQDYIPESLKRKVPQSLQKSFEAFIELPKRMGPATHNALSRALLDFSNQLVPYLTEQRYAGRLIYGGGDDVLAFTNLWEWDQWLWDIRQCFKGEPDPKEEFDEKGDYWRWKGQSPPPLGLQDRPLFTMGSEATISFGIIIAHHSVPLAIALEQLWEAEGKAKEYRSPSHAPTEAKKDAVQVRVLYGNGNISISTSPFPIFHYWQSLLAHLEQSAPDEKSAEKLPALLEAAAALWQQHPSPVPAIHTWVEAFCVRRDLFKSDEWGEGAKDRFRQDLSKFLYELSFAFEPQDFDKEVQNWLKLAAFTLRKRSIAIRGSEK